MSRPERSSVKFKVLVSRLMYGMVVFFFVMTVVWTVIVDVVLLGQIINDIGAFLLMGVVLPIVWFLVFLFTVKCTFFTYHELTDEELIVSVPPFRFRVPLEEIIEMESEAGKIKTDFGKVSLDVSVEEGPLEKERYWGKFKMFGTRVQNFGDEMIIQSVFSDENLVRIKSKNKNIIINVPDAKEFVEEASKAMRACLTRYSAHVIEAPERLCPKCGKQNPADARFCENCGALVEEGNLKQEDMRDRFYQFFWKALFYPFVICLFASVVLYWLALSLEYQGLIRWAWIGIMTPIIFFIGFWGLMAAFHRKTFKTTNEYTLVSLILLGGPIALLVYTVLVFLGLLPFPF
jgi:predicted nucleic acid-binding Zn ribbon protein